MTRRQSILALVLALVAGLAATIVLWRDYRDAEMKVYVALLQTMNAEPGMKDVAFMSQVSSCGSSAADVPAPYAEAARDMLHANRTEAAPRRLEKLAQLANVVRHEEAQRLHREQYRQASFARKKVIGLSRVGFSGDKAVLCMEFGHGRTLVLFEAVDGPFWREVSYAHHRVQ